MQIPVILHLGAASEAAPLVAAALARQPVRGARACVLAWCGVLVLANGLQLMLALHGLNNLWVGYVVSAASALVLWALSYWQTGYTARLTLRVATIGFLAVWAFLTLAFEDTSSFSRAAEPMAYLVCLVAAAYTLLTRSHGSGGALLRQDWFWVSAGLALYFGSWSAMGPLSVLFVRGAPDLLKRAYEVQTVLTIAAFVAIARGMTCPAAT